MTGGLRSIPLDRFKALREARLEVQALREYALESRSPDVSRLALAAQAAWEAEVDRVFKEALGLPT